MAGLKLSAAEIGCIATFERITGAITKDCITNEDSSVTFVVKPDSMGLAIGKGGSNIKHAVSMLKRDVDVVEYSEDPVKFIKNVMHPIRPKDINIEDKDSKTVAKVAVERRDRAAAIGSRGRNVQRIKKIVKRHHRIDDLMII